MTFDIIRLQFDAPLHLSNARPNDYGSSERVIHSDTFTAAVFQAWATLGKTEWIPKNESESPGFVVSSLFPFHGGKIANAKRETNDLPAPIYFLPKPFFRHKAENSGVLEAGDAKKYKKVKFLDVPHFESYLHQRELPSLGTSAIKSQFQSRQLINLTTDDADFMTADVQTRLVKPRDESEPTPYYIERIYFRYKSGLWCLIQYDSDEHRRRVEAAVRYLGDAGLGTDRAVGNGQFTPTFGTLDLDLPQKGQFAVSLSLFCPKSPKELASVLTDPQTRYDTIRRGGWLSEPHNTYRKRSVWMFQEGSLLHYPTDRPTILGRLVDLQPDESVLPTKIGHSVWRDGRALLLPVNR